MDQIFPFLGIRFISVNDGYDSARIVRRVFELAGAGMTVREITRLFNAEKVPTPSAIKNSQGHYHKWWVGVEGVELWSEEMVIRILRDERYLGKTVYGKRYRPQV